MSKDSESEEALVNPFLVGPVSSQRMIPYDDNSIGPMSRDMLAELLAKGIKTRLPKKTFRQRFWDFFRSLFESLANYCERKQSPDQYDVQNHKLAERMANILSENMSQLPGGTFVLFDGIGDSTAPHPDLDKEYGPAIQMVDNADVNPSKIPESIAANSTEDCGPDTNESARREVEDNLRKYRLRQLLDKDEISSEEEQELMELTTGEDVIVLE